MPKQRSHGDGSITERGRNRWRLRYDGPPNTDGSRKQVSETVRGTKVDAGRILRERIRAVEHGTFVQPTTITTTEYLEAWLNRHSKNITPKTASGYAFLFRRYIVPVIGNLPLQSLEPQHVRAILDSVQDQGLSTKTASLAHSALRRALADAVDDGQLLLNPAGRVRAPRVRRRSVETWNAGQIGVFLTAAIDSPFAYLFELAVLTGMRRSELTGLRWANVVLSDRTLRVVETLQRVDGKGLVSGIPKSDRGRRELALSDRAVNLLHSIQSRQLEWQLRAGAVWQKSGYVFTDELGAPLDGGRASKAFSRVAKTAGLTGATLHSLRHAHASLLISQGTHIKVVSERLGHASTSFTMDTYAHLLPGMQEAAAEAIDAALAVK